MKLGNIVLLFVLAIASAWLLGCSLGEEPLPYISGSVTVSNLLDWNTLKLGVFYASETDTDVEYYIYFEPTYESATSDYIARATYYQNNDATVYSFTPEAGAATTISQTSGLNGTFRADLDPAATTTGYHYVLAWLDANDNGLLDLKDSSDDAVQISDSEFNRCPIYNPDSYYAKRFYVDSDYGYKFNGYDGSTNYFEELSSVDQSDFSFDLNPTVSGW